MKPKSLFVNADKIALDNLELHQKSLGDQIKAFEIYSSLEINRPDIQKAWTDHYIEDEQTKLNEQFHLEILARMGFDAKTIFRAGMEAVIVGNKYS